MNFNFFNQKSQSKEEMVSGCDRETIPNPVICLFDVKSDVEEKLVETGFNITSASLGTPIRVPNIDTHSQRSHPCIPIKQVPSNLHEYDIAIVDLRKIEPKNYIPDENFRKEVKGNNVVYLVSSYPETLFDPRPFIANSIKDDLKEVLKKHGLIIIFACKNFNIDYNIVTIDSSPYPRSDQRKYDIYQFIPRSHILENKDGVKISPEPLKNPFYSLLSKHSENCFYHVTFRHPFDYDKNKDSEYFIPLMFNSSNEIVSYVEFVNGGTIIVFPDIQDKSSFLNELLSDVLPVVYPNLFPYYSKHKWLENERYYLPNKANLLEKKEKIKEEFDEKLTEINVKIDDNDNKYSCLHDILTKDSKDLVKAVQKFLKWLEFENVEYMDDEGELEEDLKIESPDGVLVIEVKGIGGTSTDSDCSQINKIKHRRREELMSFDVFGLYIVNHQKHLPPLERKNPPFTDNQIKDANNEKRGLLTTWQLFNLYYSIKNGILTKGEVRESLFNFGLIDFKPERFRELGKPEKLHNNGTVILFDAKIPISKSDSLVIFRDGIYYPAKIKELQSNNVSIESIDSGKVGIEIDKVAKMSDIFYLI